VAVETPVRIRMIAVQVEMEVEVFGYYVVIEENTTLMDFENNSSVFCEVDFSISMVFLTLNSRSSYYHDV